MRVQPMCIIAAGVRCSRSSRMMRSDTAVHDVDPACVHDSGQCVSSSQLYSAVLCYKWRRSIDLYACASAWCRARCIASQLQHQQQQQLTVRRLLVDVPLTWFALHVRRAISGWSGDDGSTGAGARRPHTSFII